MCSEHWIYAWLVAMCYIIVTHKYYICQYNWRIKTFDEIKTILAIELL